MIIHSLPALVNELGLIRKNSLKTVFTNGCFDILHPGHVELLKGCKAHGDIVIVGLNSDKSVKSIKGKNRPINNQDYRACILSSLKYVNFVVLFDEERPMNLIKSIRPNVYIKGGDYRDKDIPEFALARSVGSKVVVLPMNGHHSTTTIIDRIKNI